ncbi:MAG: hypothetical protein WA160_16420 [Pseudobdellovibrio sp.]
MKTLLTFLVAMSTCLTVMANPRTEQEISEKLLANAKNMGVVTAGHQEMYGKADRHVNLILSEADGVRVVCSPVQASVESCILIGNLKISVPDGGPQKTITKILIFKLVDGVATGDVTVAQ